MFKYWIYKILWVYKVYTGVFLKWPKCVHVLCCPIMSYLPCLYVARWAWLCCVFVDAFVQWGRPCSGPSFLCLYLCTACNTTWRRTVILSLKTCPHQDSWWPMPFRLRRSTISLEGSTSWLWPFGIFLRFPRSLKSCWHNDTSLAVNPSTCAHPRSASSGTLDSRKICTTVLFVCSRTHI